MRLYHIGAWRLHKEFNAGKLHEDYTDTRYKFLGDLSSKRCEDEFFCFLFKLQGTWKLL
jgi:hypothetical protein